MSKKKCAKNLAFLFLALTKLLAAEEHGMESSISVSPVIENTHPSAAMHPGILSYEAETKRLLAWGLALESIAKAKLTLAQSAKATAEANTINQRIQFLDQLMILLRNDIKQLSSIQASIYLESIRAQEHLKKVQPIRDQGLLFSTGSAPTKYRDALFQLMSREDGSVAPQITEALKLLAKQPSYRKIIDEEGTILPYNRDKGEGLGPQNFKFPGGSSDGEIEGFAGGDLIDLLNFMNENRYNFKSPSRALMIFNTAMAKYDELSKRTIIKRVEVFTPIRENLISHWRELYKGSANGNLSDGEIAKELDKKGK